MYKINLNFMQATTAAMRVSMFVVIALFFVAPTTANPLKNRIIGGHPVNITLFPYTASLTRLSHHTCGAALIAPTAALTAAHCVPLARHAYRLRFGATNLTAGGGQLRRVARIVRHPAYRPHRTAFDVAILLVEGAPLALNAAVRVVALPTEGARVPPAGTMGWVSGWGVEREDEVRGSDVLRAVQVPVWAQADCRMVYEGWMRVDGRVFCAGYTKGRKDSCQGDSGGPLVADGILWGLVSLGRGCAGEYSPGIYTNVVEFLDFIKRYVNI